MPWKGPFEEGVSQSLLNKFLVCPYRFYLYAILGLEERQPLHENLVWGDTFHKGLELLIELHHPPTPDDWERIDEAIDRHLQQYVPFPQTFPYSIKHMLRLYEYEYKDEIESPLSTEVVFSFMYQYTSIYTPRPVILRGKKDGCCDNYIIEHKCKGFTDQESSRQEIKYDLQVNMYGLHTLYKNPQYDCVNYIYDIIRIPDGKWTLPKRRLNQTLKNWVWSWYHEAQTSECPIANKRYLWLDQFVFTLTEKQINYYCRCTLNPILDRLILWWEVVSSPDFDFQNPNHYSPIFYQTPIRHFNPSNTENFKPEYFNFLTQQISLDDLTPVRSYFPELESGATNET